MSASRKSPRLIDAIDTLAKAESFLECAFLAVHAPNTVSRHACDAIASAMEEAQTRMAACKADLYRILDGQKGGES